MDPYLVDRIDSFRKRYKEGRNSEFDDHEHYYASGCQRIDPEMDDKYGLAGISQVRYKIPDALTG